MFNGKRTITRQTAQKLHDAYGLSIAWLLTGEGDMMARGAAAGGDAASMAKMQEQIDKLIDQNQKLIDLLAASYKNNNN